MLPNATASHFASGDHNPGRDHFGTFNQLFPNAHAWFGWTDLVGRQNITDISLYNYVFPTKWILLGTQYHILRLDSARDALYNGAGAVVRSDPTGRAGTLSSSIRPTMPGRQPGWSCPTAPIYCATIISAPGTP